MAIYIDIAINTNAYIHSFQCHYIPVFRAAEATVGLGKLC